MTFILLDVWAKSITLEHIFPHIHQVFVIIHKSPNSDTILSTTI